MLSRILSRPNTTRRRGLGLLTLSLLAATSVQAQQIFVTSDTTINSDVSGNDIFVGKDDLVSFTTLPGTIVLTVSDGAYIDANGTSAPDSNFYYGLNVFGGHQADITGGTVNYAFGHDTSTTNISGGTTSYAYGYNSSTTNISGGSVSQNLAYASSTTNIAGGNVSYAYGSATSTTNISGGTVGYAYGDSDSTFNITGGTVGGFSTNSIDAYTNTTFNISGGSLTGGIGLLDSSVLNLAGTGFSTVSGDVYGYFDGSSNYYVRDYTITGNLSDGTAFSKTITGAANSSTLGLTDVQLHGLRYDVATDRYVTVNESVTGVYSNVTVGRDITGTVNTSPTASFEAGLDAGNVAVYNASEVTMNGGLIHNSVNLYDTSTVNVSGGTVGYVNSYGNSTTNITDGAVSNYVYSTDTATTNVSGGSVYTIFYSGNNTVNVSGGTTNSIGDSSVSADTTTINVLGGSVNSLYVSTNDIANISGGTVANVYAYFTNSIVNISGGTLTNVTGYDNSAVNVSGGSVEELLGFQDAVFTLTGGTISTDTIRLFDNSLLSLYGADLNYSLTTTGSDGYGAYTAYLLSGTLQNGQSIDGVSLYDYDGGLSVGDPEAGEGNLVFTSAVVTVPEPGTFALILPVLGMLGVLAARRRK